jgi:hypothetical protein
MFVVWHGDAKLSGGTQGLTHGAPVAVGHCVGRYAPFLTKNASVHGGRESAGVEPVIYNTVADVGRQEFEEDPAG